jgi:rhodanese-related sulfurtransferase
VKKHLIAILIVIFIFTAFTVTGCVNKTIGVEKSTAESMETSVEATTQEVEPSEETSQGKTPVIMMITPDEVYRIISEGRDYFLLDVRTPEEYSEGHIEGANLIPVQELESRLDEIPGDKQIIVYCRSGNRSRTAASILMENGFGMVYDMGGINSWIEKGYPVITGEITGARFEEITVDEAYQLFSGDEDHLFIDIRSKDEYDTIHIEGAIHIPVSEIQSRLSEIPEDKLIIVYCDGSSCNRSSDAAGILVKNGYSQVYNLMGNGIFEWVEKGYPVSDPS